MIRRVVSELSRSKDRAEFVTIMAITNHDRVGKAMELLKGGLGPFVEREFKSICKDRAAAEVVRVTWARTA